VFAEIEILGPYFGTLYAVLYVAPLRETFIGSPGRRVRRCLVPRTCIGTGRRTKGKFGTSETEDACIHELTTREPHQNNAALSVSCLNGAAWILAYLLRKASFHANSV
jgi:hypothetical protein